MELFNVCACDSGGSTKAQPEHRRGGRRGNRQRKHWLFHCESWMEDYGEERDGSSVLIVCRARIQK